MHVNENTNVCTLAPNRSIHSKGQYFSPSLCQIRIPDPSESCLHTLHPTAAKGRDGAQPKTQWAFHSEGGKDIPFGSARRDVASVGHVTQAEWNKEKKRSSGTLKAVTKSSHVSLCWSENVQSALWCLCSAARLVWRRYDTAFRKMDLCFIVKLFVHPMMTIIVLHMNIHIDQKIKCPHTYSCFTSELALDFLFLSKQFGSFLIINTNNNAAVCPWMMASFLKLLQVACRRREQCNVDQTWLLFTAKIPAWTTLTSQSYLLYLLGCIKQSLSPVRVGYNSLNPKPSCADFLDALIRQSRQRVFQQSVLH